MDGDGVDGGVGVGVGVDVEERALVVVEGVVST